LCAGAALLIRALAGFHWPIVSNFKRLIRRAEAATAVAMIAPPSNTAPDRNLRSGILWILLSCCFFAAMWAAIRVASAQIHPFALVFWRNSLGLMFLLVFLPAFGRGAWLRTSRPFVHMRRAASGIVATVATFYAVVHAPMATAISISYAAPLFATIAAVLFFGETIRMRRISALTIGFIGILIVLRPGAIPMSMGIAAAMIASVATAFSIVSVKQLTNSEDQRTIVFYSFALMLLPSLIIAWPYLQWPQGQEWFLILPVGLLAVLGQSTLVKAYTLAETSALLPYDFVRFILVITIGIIWFGEHFDVFTLIGGSIILASTLYLAHRERVAAHSSKPTAAPKDIS
jgi:drug/metabolite transporter (DMT)-like permease